MLRFFHLLIFLCFLLSSAFASLTKEEKESWKIYLREQILLTPEQKPWLFKQEAQNRISHEFGRFWTGIYAKEDPFYQKLGQILHTKFSYDTLSLLLEYLSFYQVGTNPPRTTFYFYHSLTQLTLRIKPNEKTKEESSYRLCFYDSEKTEDLEACLAGEDRKHSSRDLRHELCKISLLLTEDFVFPLLLPKSRYDMLSYEEFLERFSLSGQFHFHREIYELLQKEAMKIAHPLLPIT